MKKRDICGLLNQCKIHSFCLSNRENRNNILP